MNLLVFLSCLSDFPFFIYNFRLRVLLHKKGNVIHQAVCHCVMRDNGRNADHNDLMGILLIDLRCRYMISVLEFRDKALYYHPFFFQAVNPRGTELERQGCYFHDQNFVTIVRTNSSATSWSNSLVTKSKTLSSTLRCSSVNFGLIFNAVYLVCAFF